jgi:hypothetical protein
MAVIYGKSFGSWWALTDSARTVLLGKHLVVIVHGDTVSLGGGFVVVLPRYPHIAVTRFAVPTIPHITALGGSAAKLSYRQDHITTGAKVIASGDHIEIVPPEVKWVTIS